MTYLPYEEPGIITILSLASFLILLNAIRYMLDKLLYCGLIGEIFIGVIWGLPVGGTAWLSKELQQVVQTMGYLGLIGLVFEGGLGTAPSQLRKSMFISIPVAIIGLLIPISLTFLLLLLPFETTAGTAFLTPVAAFSAGASLCSTSLGTTFAMMSSTDMKNTRAGVVLIGAAMMDDVVGLVMVNIVTTLGDGVSCAWSIARPVIASFGFLLVTLFITRIAIKPVRSITVAYSSSSPNGNDPIMLSTTKLWFSPQPIILIRRIPHITFVLSTSVLIVFVTIASFVYVSILFAAFLAGSVVSYLWNCNQEESSTQSAMIMYRKYYKPVMDSIFVPFFFASIGFSIPIGSMFEGSVFWKGIVYAVLMAAAKASVAVVLYLEYYVCSWWPHEKRRRQTSPGRFESIQSTPHAEALLVASAMIARGEIGFLIASLSQSSSTLTLRVNGMLLGSSESESVFLVIIWAVVLCTIIGPVLVGFIVRRQARNIGRH